jgi:hypothetical protein
MARSVLLNSSDPWFPFEHAMAHRNALGIMAPLDRFSAIPYFVEPDLGDNRPASMWNLDHQSAHNDALDNLPSYFGATTVGLRIGQNLIDSNLDDAEQRTWFTFQNHMEHMIGGDTILPNTAFPEPAPQWRWPFW